MANVYPLKKKKKTKPNSKQLVSLTASVGQELGSSLAGWMGLQSLMELRSDVGWAAVRWRSDWSWGIWLQDGLFTRLLAGGLSSSPWGPLLRRCSSVLMTWRLGIQETKAEATMPFMTLLQKSHTVLCHLRYCSHRESWFKAGRAHSRARGLVGEDPVGRKSVFGDWTVTASWNIRAERVLRDHLFQHPHSIAEENKGQQH